MSDPASVAPACDHVKVTINFHRTGTHLHPTIWMSEVCLACGKELDTKVLSRPSDRGERVAKKVG